MSECQDIDRDHACDVCSSEITKCTDTDNDHLCDVCEARLSDCVDHVPDYICDMCGGLLPWLTVTIEKDCYVNGSDEDKVFDQLSSYKVSLQYAGFDSKIVTEWIIYDEYGNEYDRVANSHLYTFIEGGVYHIVPVYVVN